MIKESNDESHLASLIEAYVRREYGTASASAGIRFEAGREGTIVRRVTMYVTDPKVHEGGFTVIAQVTGDYVKTGLPDPLE